MPQLLNLEVVFPVKLPRKYLHMSGHVGGCKKLGAWYITSSLMPIEPVGSVFPVLSYH